MTYSILAQCPRTGRLGLGTATNSLATGSRAGAIKSHLGVAKTQAKPKPENDMLALDLLAQGYRPARVLEMIGAGEPFWEFRQMGIIDRDGYAAAHTGPKAFPHAGHHVEQGLVVLGNGVVGRHIIEAMVAGFKACPGAPLEERIMQSLEAGRDAGGQARNGVRVPERSSVLRIAGWHDWLEIDLAVDQEQGAVEQTRRALDAFVLQESKGVAA